METKGKRIKRLEIAIATMQRSINRQGRQLDAVIKFFGLVAREDRTKYQSLYYAGEARKTKEVMKRRQGERG